MFDLIDFRRRTPLEWLPVEARDASYVMIHKHHIVPRAWFKANKLPVDNSKENLVNLTILEHIQIHILLKNHFKFVGNEDLSYRMAIAVSQLCNTNIQDVLKLDSISDVDPQLLTQIEENAVEASIAHSHLSIEFWKSISSDKRKSIGSKIS